VAFTASRKAGSSQASIVNRSMGSTPGTAVWSDGMIGVFFSHLHRHRAQDYGDTESHRCHRQCPSVQLDDSAVLLPDVGDHAVLIVDEHQRAL